MAALEEEKAALQRELDALRSGRSDDRTAPLVTELANAKAKIETLKSKVRKLEKDKTQDELAAKLKEMREEIMRAKVEHATRTRELQDIEADIEEAKTRLTRIKKSPEYEPEPPPVNRDAVLARLHEERNELARELQLVRTELEKRKKNAPSWLAKLLAEIGIR